jgi:flagellar biosynthesis regulator FlaF
LRDARNTLPPETRAGLVSIGLSVQREMDSDEPNFDFLITINKNIADGLSDSP